MKPFDSNPWKILILILNIFLFVFGWVFSVTKTNLQYSITDGGEQGRVIQDSFIKAIGSNISDLETITKDIDIAPAKTGTDAKQGVKSTGTQQGASKNTASLRGFVKGRVLDEATGKGIPEATVSLKRSGLTIVSAMTPSDGGYFFQALPGDYSITAIKKGFDEDNSDLTLIPFNTITKNILLSSAIFPTTPVPTPSPIPTLTPIPTVTPVPPSLGCEGGGAPGKISLFPDSLIIRSGNKRNARVQVLKENGEGCSINVTIDCLEGCDKIKPLKTVINTNSRGVAIVSIKAERRVTGLTVLMFSVGDVKAGFPITIIR